MLTFALVICFTSFTPHYFVCTHLTVMECQPPPDAALGAKRQQGKTGVEKGQRHQGTHQQHQKPSQVSKAQLNSKTTLKGTTHFHYEYFFTLVYLATLLFFIAL